MYKYVKHHHIHKNTNKEESNCLICVLKMENFTHDLRWRSKFGKACFDL